MKNLVLILSILCSISAFANNANPVEHVIVENESVSCIINDDESKAVITSVVFDQESEDISYELEKEVSFIQIYDADNTLQFQLPVGAKKVHVSLETFEQGTYDVIFLTSDNMSVHTEVQKK